MAVLANAFLARKSLLPSGGGEVEFVFLNQEGTVESSAGVARVAVPSAAALEQFKVGEYYRISFDIVQREAQSSPAPVRRKPATSRKKSKSKSKGKKR